MQILGIFSKRLDHYGIAENAIIAEKFWYSRSSQYAYSKNNTLPVEFERIHNVAILIMINYNITTEKVDTNRVNGHHMLGIAEQVIMPLQKTIQPRYNSREFMI